MPHELTTKQIEDIAFAVLRSHNDDRLWRALTYDSGPYDVTKATLALQDLASAFFRAGIASAPAAPAQAVPLTIRQEEDALQQFTDWFVRNYPGPDTIISDPRWHAPKVFRQAMWAIERGIKAAP